MNSIHPHFQGDILNSFSSAFTRSPGYHHHEGGSFWICWKVFSCTHLPRSRELPHTETSPNFGTFKINIHRLHAYFERPDSCPNSCKRASCFQWVCKTENTQLNTRALSLGVPLSQLIWQNSTAQIILWQ